MCIHDLANRLRRGYLFKQIVRALFINALIYHAGPLVCTQDHVLASPVSRQLKAVGISCPCLQQTFTHHQSKSRYSTCYLSGGSDTNQRIDSGCPDIRFSRLQAGAIMFAPHIRCILLTVCYRYFTADTLSLLVPLVRSDLGCISLFMDRMWARQSSVSGRHPSLPLLLVRL